MIRQSSSKFPWQTNAETPYWWHITSQDMATSVWLMHIFLKPWPIRSTTQTWVVMHHQYGVSALFPQVSFCGETSTGNAKCWLIYQPDQRAKCLQYFNSLNFLINVTSFLAPQITSTTMLARAFKFKLLVYS